MSDELRSICDTLRHLLETRGVGARVRRSCPCPFGTVVKVLHRLRHGAYVFREDWDSSRRPREASPSRHGCQADCQDRDRAVTHAPPPSCWARPSGTCRSTRSTSPGSTEGPVVAKRGSFSTAGRSPPDEVVHVDGVAVTSATRTALDMTMIADIEHCLCAIIDFLLHVRGDVPPSTAERQRGQTDVTSGRPRWRRTSRSDWPMDGASRWASPGRATCSGAGRCPHPSLSSRSGTRSGRVVARG